ncbi:terminase TerL endonuclease subunit [Falsiruegeria mediterranea]|uniref:terminase TerL endonuclease subunit n=1 Tax=Falsiruegeria mediterranea TaxID=1280832 RepID=UPI0015F2893C|nr:terminase TerL endonuclease subunit [Falsiruegeria mediterranea]
MHATDAQSLVPVLSSDSHQAERFVTLCGKVLLTQGPEAGKRLEACWLPWQRDALAAIYQCRESLLIMGKGSGKSMTIAALAIGYVMLSALRGINTRGQIVIMAANIEGARIVFQHIQEAILADDVLRPLFKSNVTAKSLTHEATGIVIQIISCSMKNAVGRRPILLLLDELHEMAQLGEATAAVNQLRQGGGNWGAAFKCISISTMPINAPEGEFRRQLAYARGVRDGRIDDPDFLPLLYTFPMAERPDLDPLDGATWWRGMPSLRTEHQPGTMDAAELERELRQVAAADDTESFALILSQRLGIERNDTDGLAESVLHSHWSRCEQVAPEGPYQFTAVGIDAGGTDDPMAVCVARKRGRALDMWVTQFITRTGYERATANTQEVYDLAVENGTLHLFDTSDECQQAVFDMVRQAHPNKVGGDEHGISGFAQALRDATGHAFESVPQNWQLSAALASLESRLLDGAVRHSHCPLLMSNVENLLITELPSGVRKLTKRDNRLSGQGYSKIDGIIACINATQLVDTFGQRTFDAARLIG